MDDEAALSNILTDIVFMNYVGMQPVLVHGGGKAINQAMETAGLAAADGAWGGDTPMSGRWRSPSMYCAIRSTGSSSHFIQSQGCEAMGLHSLSSVVLFAEKTYLKGPDGRRIDLGLCR